MSNDVCLCWVCHILNDKTVSTLWHSLDRILAAMLQTQNFEPFVFMLGCINYWKIFSE